MQRITANLVEYGTNNPIQITQLPAVPREGEFFILQDHIGKDWNDYFYRVRAVTYYINCEEVIIHLERYDQDAEQAKWNRMIENIETIRSRVQNAQGCTETQET